MFEYINCTLLKLFEMWIKYVYILKVLHLQTSERIETYSFHSSLRLPATCSKCPISLRIHRLRLFSQGTVLLSLFPETIADSEYPKDIVLLDD